MREALLTVLTVCAAGACADNVMSAFEDGGRNIGRYVRLVVVLFVICTVFLPIVNNKELRNTGAFSADACFSDDAAESGSADSSGLVVSECRRELEEKIAAELCKKYGFGINDVRVGIELTEENDGGTLTLSFARVTAELAESAVGGLDTEEVTEYVESITGCADVGVFAGEAPEKGSEA